MDSELRFEVPTWNQIYNMLLTLSGRIRADGFKPDIIVGVSRGGWAPARVLSDLLDNPNLANVKAEFYLGVAETKGEPTLTQSVSAVVAEKRVLIVDEVADTGKSLKLVKEHIINEGATEVKVVTVYYKPWSVIVPDYYVKETSHWIVFPWEIKETIRKIIKKCKKNRKPLEKETAKLEKAGIPAEIIKRFLREIFEERNC
ncbi:MAG: phosphoribosyltransferase [Candidatus Bathyarchaeota archaeon]|nr:phosphoribosyltransferase [Candidatus Bathyarchaeota archaeon]MDH5788483.1 phosphoribosyltransferase [Candidatus Bathyarchaeota archaeon]